MQRQMASPYWIRQAQHTQASNPDTLKDLKKKQKQRQIEEQKEKKKKKKEKKQAPPPKNPHA